MREAHDNPRLHSLCTIATIENAVEKMGGWKYVQRFFRNWVNQFYSPTARKGIQFPLPSCKTWFPDMDCAADGTCKSLPTSLSLTELHQLQAREIAPNTPQAMQVGSRNMLVAADFQLLGSLE